ncbi:hypothetical protein [Merismopedia glauca]|uniref:Uncharacterized protein n=1 Tax=Merismopedia glauca CCAP 1448/3 TaxID=1296344 RepID=A0A2T1BY88_9CYAN|nr:hypothetical protein [Merismopedia glauca]PSB00868.1 hypothetical protein C7B64_21245 [Merismopedia glauca CCAP 1448/3]
MTTTYNYINPDSLLHPRLKMEFIRTWLEITQTDVANISPSDKASIHYYHAEDAKQIYCQERSQELKSEVHKRRNLPQKTVMVWLMVLFGGLSMTGVGTIMGQRWGIFTIPATFVFGAVTTLCSDDRAKKAIAACQMKHNSRTALETLKAQRQESAHFPFKQHYYTVMVEKHQEVEKQALKPDIARDVGLSGTIFLGESGISLALLGLAGFPGGWLLALLASALPLGVNCIGAAVQSDWYEFPELCDGLAQLYESQISPGNEP